MSLIAPVVVESTAGPVRELLEGVKKSLGGAPNLFRVTAQSPAALASMVQLFGAVGGGKLDAKHREAIALVVSERNGCAYCLSAHSALAQRAGLGEEDRTLAREGRAKDPHLAAAVHLAKALVDHRGHFGDAAFAAAKAAGLDDAEILEVVANVALTTFTNYVNELVHTDLDFPVVPPLPR